MFEIMSFDNIFLLPQLFPDYPNLPTHLTSSSLSFSPQIKANKQAKATIRPKAKQIVHKKYGVCLELVNISWA